MRIEFFFFSLVVEVGFERCEGDLIVYNRSGKTLQESETWRPARDVLISTDLNRLIQILGLEDLMSDPRSSQGCGV